MVSDHIRVAAVLCMMFAVRASTSAFSVCTAEEEQGVLLVQTALQLNRKTASEIVPPLVMHSVQISKSAKRFANATISFEANHVGAPMGYGGFKATPNLESTELTPMAFLMSTRVWLLVLLCAAWLSLKFRWQRLQEQRRLKPPPTADSMEEQANDHTWEEREPESRQVEHDRDASLTTETSKMPAVIDETPVDVGRKKPSMRKPSTQLSHGLQHCLHGIATLLKQPRSGHRPLYDPCTLPMLSDTGDDLIGGSSDAAPLADDHPNFTGVWKCVGVEGDPDGFLKDTGYEYYKRAAASAAGYGVGAITRVYENDSLFIKYMEKGLRDSEQQYEISGEEQHQVGLKGEPFLSKTYWDPVKPHVLIFESLDFEKKDPTSWTTTRQYLIDKDTFVHEASAFSGSKAVWIWARETAPQGPTLYDCNDATADPQTLAPPEC